VAQSRQYTIAYWASQPGSNAIPEHSRDHERSVDLISVCGRRKVLQEKSWLKLCDRGRGHTDLHNMSHRAALLNKEPYGGSEESACGLNCSDTRKKLEEARSMPHIILI
jgi:hypothetical protein